MSLEEAQGVLCLCPLSKVGEVLTSLGVPKYPHDGNPVKYVPELSAAGHTDATGDVSLVLPLTGLISSVGDNITKKHGHRFPWDPRGADVLSTAKGHMNQQRHRRAAGHAVSGKRGR